MAFVAPFPSAASVHRAHISPSLSPARPSRPAPAAMTLARPTTTSPARSASPTSPLSPSPSSSSPSPAAAVVPAVTPAPSAAPSASPDEPIPAITGHAEFLAACAASVDDALVVVQVKAPWCRSCKALEPKVRRLAREYMGTVRFFSMNYEDPENKPIAFRAGVKSMPTFMFFCGAAGKVEQFTCGPNRAGLLREKIEVYVAGECAVAEDGASEVKAGKPQVGRP